MKLRTFWQTLRQPLDQQGQMILIAPLVMVIAIGTIMYWGYAQVSQKVSLTEKNAVTVNQLFQSMEQRIVSVITQQVPSPGPCDTLMLPYGTASLTSLSQFSNFSLSPLPQPVIGTMQLGKAGFITAGWLGCIVLTSEQALMSNNYPGGLNITATVSMLKADPNGGSTTVSINLAADFNSARPGAPAQHTTSQQISQYTIRPASLKSYAVVLAPPFGGYTPATPYLNATGGSTLRIIGSVYWDSNPGTGAPALTANLPDALTLPAAAGLTPTVIVEKHFDIRSENVSGVAVDLGTLQSALRNGFNTSVLEGGLLPIEDDGDMGHSAWQQNFDYTNMNTFPPNPAVLVLPDLNPPSNPYFGAGSIGTPLAVVINYPTPGQGPPPYVYTAASANYCGGAGCNATSSPLPGTMQTIPDLGAGKQIETLGQSCADYQAEPNQAKGLAVPFIFLREDQDLTINMTGADLLFCGLVRARNIIVNVPNGATGYIQGQLIAQSITVNGTGSTLVVNNPMDQMGAVPVLNNAWSLDLPGSLAAETFNQQNIVLEWLQFGATYAQPFFAPMYTSITAPVAPTIAMFRPHGAIIGSNASPAATPGGCPTPADTSCVGYMYPCTTATNTNPPYNAGNTYLYCLKNANTAPPPVYSSSMYFVATPIL
jgi:hypothetical protein